MHLILILPSIGNDLLRDTKEKPRAPLSGSRGESGNLTYGINGNSIISGLVLK